MVDHGRDRIELMMRAVLAETLDMMTLVTPANPNWTDVFVQDFLAQHSLESLDDFVLFLQMFRRSELHDPGKPQLYGGRVDGSVMFECWERYMIRKTDLQEREGINAERNAQNEHLAAFAANPSIQSIARDVAARNNEEKAALNREVQLRREQHRIEGLNQAENGRSVAEFALVLLNYPYQTVRGAVERRCRELALPFEEVLNYRIY